jgi:DNA-binding HxlR family transcriptional regulator
MSYGQFCSIARALDLLGERWTLLVVREFLCGAHRFGEIQRGVPRISRTMLSARLRALCDGGVIERHGDGYRLTAAGRELAPVVMAVGTWGQRWLSRHLDDDELDPDVVVWDMHRRVDRDALPAEPVLVTVEIADVPPIRARRYLLLRRAEVSLCTTNPGFAAELVVRADRRTLIHWWRGDWTFAEARRHGLAVTGRRDLARALPGWFERYVLADVAPARAT